MKTIDLRDESGTLEVLFPSDWKCESFDKTKAHIEILNKEPSVPTDWEEYCTNHNITFNDSKIFDDLLGICSYDDIASFIAMFKLRRLWHSWCKIHGYPDESNHYYIKYHRGLESFVVLRNGAFCNSLTFRTEKQAEEFINHFRNLLTIARVIL